MSDGTPLKLRAHDVEDLDVISAILQDALVPLVDAAFRPHEKRFVLVANRFDWTKNGDLQASAPVNAAPEGDAAFEDAADEPPFHRINCGICFDRVKAVRSRGIDLSDQEQILNLLAIKGEEGAVTLLFSGGGAIRLEVSLIRCHIEDLGESWPTRWRPDHETPQQSEESGPEA